MKAVYITEHGGTGALTYGDLPTPVPSGSEVLVKVGACALNHLDLWVRGGLKFQRVPFPFVPGSDVSGEVVERGPGAPASVIGMRVILGPGLVCHRCEFCHSGRHNLCPEARLLGNTVPGGYAEYLKIPVQNLVPLPDSIDLIDGACLPVVFTTAWSMLFDKVRLQPGEWILVHAAGSGVGTAAIQLARMIGARVITTASTDEKLEQAAELGADHCINYTDKDFLREVRKITKRRGVDVVFEHIGGKVFERSLLCLRPGGRLTTCGNTLAPIAQTDLRHVFFRNLEIYGNSVGSKSILFRIVKLVEAGLLKPVLDTVLPLSKAQEAQDLLHDRKQFGKVVLVPDAS